MTKHDKYKRENRPRHPWKTFFKVVLWCVGILIVLCVAAIITISIYLSPKRLSDIASREASEYLDAKIEVKGLNYTLFRTWPTLRITWDSVYVISKSLDHLPDSDKSRLPVNYAFLASTGAGEIELDAKDLIHKEIDIKKIDVAHPVANLVMLNDSIGNFFIIPDIKKNISIPEIDLGDIRLEAPLMITFANVERDMEGMLEIENFMLAEIDGKKNNLEINLNGCLAGRMGEISLPEKVPIALSSIFNMGKNSSGIDIQKFNLRLASLESELYGKVTFNPSEINFLHIKVSESDILNLEKYIPENFLSLLPSKDQFNGELGFDINLQLDSPYPLQKLTSGESLGWGDLPSFRSNATIYGSDIACNLPGLFPMEIDSLNAITNIKYDRDKVWESEINLPLLVVSAKGMNVEMSADAQGIFSESPSVEAQVEFKGNPFLSMKKLLAATGISAKGHITGNADISCNLKRGEQISLTGITVKGDILSRQISLSKKSSGLNAQLSNLEMALSANIPSFTGFTPSSGKMSMDIKTSEGNLTDMSGMKLLLGKMDINTNVESSAQGGSSPSTKGEIAFDLSSLSYKNNSTSATMKGIELEMKGNLLNSPAMNNSTYTPAPLTTDENLIESRISHTPLYLIPSGSGMVQTLMSLVNAQITAKVKEGDFVTDSYLANNTFSDVDVSTDLDRVDIHSMKLRSDDTGLDLKGNVSGLKNFLTSSSPSLLRIDMDANFDNVDINHLSGAYYGAIEKNTGKPYDFTVPPQGPYTASDSVCVLIPRNISGSIRLKSDRAEYMGYSFSPLSTNILVDAGNATLSKLTIGAPYCNVAVDWTYSTSSIDNIYMNLSANVEDFDFTEFFKSFPELTKSAPEMTYFSGQISANAGGRFLMYPSMFLNPASMKARFEIKGDHLQFARESKLIERITHLMLIKGDGPIKIHNIDITGSFHDNFLMIDPFSIDFDEYKLGIAGVNNLKGDMYYHLALEKSPFHMPFAVNLVGKYPHPEIRMGGTEIKDDRERMISSELESTADINIMTWLQRGWKMFVEAAAKYDLRNE